MESMVLITGTVCVVCLYILDTRLFSVEQKYFIDANSSVGYTTSTDIQTQNIPILNCLTNFMT